MPDPRTLLLLAGPSQGGEPPQFASLIMMGLIFGVFYFVLINLVLMVFNLIPVPPLDGSKVLFAFVDRRTEYQIRPILEQYGFILLLVLFFVPPGNSIGGQILGPILDGLFSLLVGV